MDLFEKIEAKRQEINAKRDEKGISTLTGLAKLIRKRRMQALESSQEPKKEKSNAK